MPTTTRSPCPCCGDCCSQAAPTTPIVVPAHSIIVPGGSDWTPIWEQVYRPNAVWNQDYFTFQPQTFSNGGDCDLRIMMRFRLVEHCPAPGPPNCEKGREHIRMLFSDTTTPPFALCRAISKPVAIDPIGYPDAQRWCCVQKAFLEYKALQRCGAPPVCDPSGIESQGIATVEIGGLPTGKTYPQGNFALSIPAPCASTQVWAWQFFVQITIPPFTPPPTQPNKMGRAYWKVTSVTYGPSCSLHFLSPNGLSLCAPVDPSCGCSFPPTPATFSPTIIRPGSPTYGNIIRKTGGISSLPLSYLYVQGVEDTLSWDLCCQDPVSINIEWGVYVGAA